MMILIMFQLRDSKNYFENVAEVFTFYNLDESSERLHNDLKSVFKKHDQGG